MTPKLTFVTALLLALHAAAGAATVEDIRFRASFNSTTEAELALGRPAPRQTSGPILFDVGRFGKALVTGEEGATLSYRVEDNLDVKQGSLSLWLLPVNWDPGERRAHMFFQFTNGTLFRLFADQSGNLVFEVGPDLVERCHVEAPLAAYPRNQWLHIVATWSATRLRIFLNGKPVAAAPCSDRFLPLMVNYNFQIGDLAHARGRTSERITLIDELTIYRRPIDENEMAHLELPTAAPISLDDPPLITVVPQRQTILVDGKVNDAEWRHAGVLTGFQNLSDHKLAPLQTVAKLACNESNLYFAIESPALKAVPLRTESRNRDDAVWNDDAVQIHLAPPGNLRYHLVVNAAGVIFDRKTTVGIDNDNTWDGPWHIVSRVADGKWQIEGKIAFSALEVPPPAGGETWRVNVTRDRVEPKNLSCWARVSQYGDTEQHGIVQFLSSGPTVKVPTIGALRDNHLEIELDIAAIGNPLTAAIKAARNNTLMLDKSLPVAAGRTVLREPWAGDPPDSLEFQITDDQGRTLYRHGVAPGAAAGLVVDIMPIPSHGICKVALREHSEAIVASGPSADIRLTSNRRNAPLRSLHFDALDHGSASGEFNIASLPAGQYTLTTTLSADGKVVRETATSFQKPDEPWADTNVGVTDAPPPWTPMRAEQLDAKTIQVDCWNRRHHFQGPLPSSIRNGKAEQLTAPASLTVRTQGHSLEWHDVKLTDLQATASTVSFQTTMTADGIDVAAHTSMAFDGMMWTSITITPRQAMPIEAVDVTIPVDARCATLRHVPGEIMLTGNTGREDGWTWEYSAKRFFLWLGNEDLGLTWFYERPDQLRHAYRQKFVQLQRRGDTMAFTARYVGDPITLDKPLTLEFGIQATPMRSRPAGWRSWGCPRSIGHSIAIPWTTEHIDRYGGGYPETTSPDFYTRYVNHLKRFGEVVPYKVLLWHSIQSPQWQYHQADWDLGGGVNKYSDTRRFWWGGRVCGAAPNFTDFIMWKLIGHIKKHNLDGAYHDLQWSSTCSNPYHGCAPGRRAIRGDREMNKRLYTAMKQLNRPTWKIDHSSSRLCSTYSGFCDMNVTGEEMCTSARPAQPSYRVWDDYFDAMRISYFKAGGAMGRQWGVVPMFLLQMAGGAPPGATEGIYSILLAHDAIPTWDAYSRDVRYQHRLWRALEAFGIGEADVKFLPYWHGDTPVKVSNFTPVGGGPIRPTQVLYETEPFDQLRPDESFGASIYHRPGKRSLVVVFNFTEDDAVARLKIDSAALDLAHADLAAVDGFSRLQWRRVGEHLDVNVKRRSCRLVWLESAPDALPGTMLPDEPEDLLLAGIHPASSQLQGHDQQLVGDLSENPWPDNGPPPQAQRTAVAQPFTLNHPASVFRFEVHMVYAGVRGADTREALQARLVRLDEFGTIGETIIDESGFTAQQVFINPSYAHFELKAALSLAPGQYALMLTKPAEDPDENYHALLTCLPPAADRPSIMIRELPGGEWTSKPRTLAMSVHGYRQ